MVAPRRSGGVVSKQKLLRYVVLPALFALLFVLSAGTMSILMGSSSGGGSIDQIIEQQTLQQHDGGDDAAGDDSGSAASNSRLKGRAAVVDEEGGHGDGAEKKGDKYINIGGGDRDSNHGNHHGGGGVGRGVESPILISSAAESEEGGSPSVDFRALHGFGGGGDDGMATGTCTAIEDRSPPITNGMYAEGGDGGGSSSSSSAPTVDDAYDAINDEVEMGDLYSSVHCIDGETAEDSDGLLDSSAVGGKSKGNHNNNNINKYYSVLPQSAQRPPHAPFMGGSSAYGFNVVNRSCFFTNVLYQFPQRFTVFLPDTDHNRRLHREGLLVPAVTLASRPYDGLGKRKKMVKNSFDYRPNVVFGPVPGKVERLLAWFSEKFAEVALMKGGGGGGGDAADSSSSSSSSSSSPSSSASPNRPRSSVNRKDLAVFIGFLSLYAHCEEGPSVDDIIGGGGAAGKNSRIAPYLKALLSASLGPVSSSSSSSSSFSSLEQKNLLKSRRAEYCRFVQGVSEAAQRARPEHKEELTLMGSRVSSSSSSLSSSSLRSFTPIPTDCSIVAYYTPIVAPWNYAHTLFCDLFGLFWGAYEFVFAGNGDGTRREDEAVRRWHWHVGGGVGAVKDAIRLLLAGNGATTAGSNGGGDGAAMSSSGSRRHGRSSSSSSSPPKVKGFIDLARRLVGYEEAGTIPADDPTANSLGINGFWSSVTSRVSGANGGLHSVDTVPSYAQPSWQRSRMLLRGRQRRHTPLTWSTGAGNGSSSTVAVSAGGFNGIEDVSSSSASSSSLVASLLDDSIPRPDLKVVATSNHYANSFELPNKNKAFEMFSRYDHYDRQRNIEAMASSSSPNSGGNEHDNTKHKDDKGKKNKKRPFTLKGAVYDRDLANNTIYRGLLAGIGTKSWSWVTDTYAASGNAHVWYAFRQHLYDVTGAFVSGGPMPSREELEFLKERNAREERERKARELEKLAKEAGDKGGNNNINKALPQAMLNAGVQQHEGSDSNENTPEPAPADDGSSSSSSSSTTTTAFAPLHKTPLRISICHKKDKRGVVNYEETLHVLAKHFAPLLDSPSSSKRREDGGGEGGGERFTMDFVLEAAVGKSAARQVEMMDRVDVFMCNEGTLATSMFLMGPGSVFISLPLVYHMANLHRLKMPAVDTWWQEPDLLRPDPRKNTGGNIDWFPQSIPWVRTFWYDHVPLNETRIQQPLRGLRNHMPEWNIIVQEEKVTRLYEKVLGYLVSQNHPKVGALGRMLDTLTSSSSPSPRDVLLGRIKYWRDVFELRKVIKGGQEGHTDDKEGNHLPPLKDGAASLPPRRSSSYFYLKPRHPTTSTALVPPSSSSSSSSSSSRQHRTNDNHDGTDDDDHNFSVNARLCKGILSATPGWSVAFNGVKCLYGMSWLCEFWTSTRYKSRSLHPKWENSGWRCGDVRTTVEEADRLLRIKAGVVRDAIARGGASASSPSSAAAVARLERGLVDPRSSVLSSVNGGAVSSQTSSSLRSQGHGAGEGDDDHGAAAAAAQMRMDAESPFLFSSTRDYPRRLEEFLFYDPRRVVKTYHTTDMKSIRPPSPDELEAIFGKERMEVRE